MSVQQNVLDQSLSHSEMPFFAKLQKEAMMGAMTLSMTTFSIVTLSIRNSEYDTRHSDTQQTNTQYNGPVTHSYCYA
jgi:hypothetical protein